MTVQECIDTIFGSGKATAKQVEDAFTIEHSLGDEGTVVSSCALSVGRNGELEIRGQFWRINQDGTADEAGTFYRTVERRDNYVRVDHRNIRVEPDYRDKDIALAHYTKAVEFYYRVGVACVFMVADEDGPVVWPQLGWQIVSEKLIDRLVSLFRDELRRLEIHPDVVDVDDYAPAIASVEILYDDGHSEYPGVRALRRLYEETHEEIRMAAWLDREQPTTFFRARGILRDRESKKNDKDGG